jgi:thiol-disulfide isomerase/thioredoxin
VALALAVMSGAGCRRTSAMVGKQAPEFSLSDLSGRAMRLANFRGRIVFLNVWPTWCAPCRV